MEVCNTQYVSRAFVQGSRAFHQNDKIYRIKIEGGEGEHSSGGGRGKKLWEVARKPQKGSSLHNPALGSGKVNTDPKYHCCPNSNHHITRLGYLPWLPEWALLTQPSRTVKGKAFYRINSVLYKYKGVLLTIRFSYPSRFESVFLDYSISVGEK